jgi:hypothetical protein
MSRVFLSHASRDNRHAIALKRWLEQAEPGLAGEIFLDLDSETGIGGGVRWAEALWQANAPARRSSACCRPTGRPRRNVARSTARPRG